MVCSVRKGFSLGLERAVNEDWEVNTFEAAWLFEMFCSENLTKTFLCQRSARSIPAHQFTLALLVVTAFNLLGYCNKKSHELQTFPVSVALHLCVTANRKGGRRLRKD